MPDVTIALDESGDLGWKFNAPYRSGGSSRFLTIASILYPQDKKQHPKRLIRSLYKKFKWPTHEEVKWADMDSFQRIEFAEKLKALTVSHPEIKLLSITVRKENVQEHIRTDGNKLYNYMIGLSLLNEMKDYDKVFFIPDPRSIKVKSGNSMHDYLQTKLWFDKRANTILTTTPLESQSCKAIQVADMLSGVVQNHYEDGKSDYWRILEPHISNRELFF
ncbi:DUF3800 domain-containing protein [Alcanivorax sp.]|uniref:DUF3800 domain-containing protein n=1 Tax=Alcanivorax sp. TaxID=1872427 RepID=UPI003BAB4E55